MPRSTMSNPRPETDRTTDQERRGGFQQKCSWPPLGQDVAELGLLTVAAGEPTKPQSADHKGRRSSGDERVGFRLLVKRLGG